MYCNGTKKGFRDFQRVVVALERRFRDRTIWMKVSEIARYWAAKELTAIDSKNGAFELRAPFACPSFTLRMKSAGNGAPEIVRDGKAVPLAMTAAARDLRTGRFVRDGQSVGLCFDLAKGKTSVGA